MRTARVQDVEIQWSKLSTQWDGWGKSDNTLLPYRLVVTHDEVVSSFGQYWNEFINAEAEDDKSPLSGVYSELKIVEYPMLNEMLELHGNLFSRVVMQTLQTDLIGFLVRSPKDILSGHKAYFLQSISALTVSHSNITIEGMCWEYTKP